jgi:hypothetical protein
MVVCTCRVCTHGTAKHTVASSSVLSFEVQEALNQEIVEILSPIDLTCRNNWNIFVSLCRKTLTLQLLKMEVISLISSEREFPSFLWSVSGGC